jgi:CPA1 family monovalent cation:H+ antiporter
MILMRAIALYLLSNLSATITQSAISLPDQTILWWGGLRGSVSIALALSVPTVLPDREKIIATVFGVVLFTLLVQGLTIKPLLQKLNLLGDAPLRQQYLELVARDVALKRVLQYIQTEQRPGIDPEFIRYQEKLIKGEIEEIQIQIDKLHDEYPNLRNFTTEQFRDELLAIEADTYAEFVRSGRLNNELAPLLDNVLQHQNQ